MTVKDIIKKYLEDNGFDGLAGEGCGCLIEDLFCCDYVGPECVPGKKINCKEKDCNECQFPIDCDGDADYVIVNEI